MSNAPANDRALLSLNARGVCALNMNWASVALLLCFKLSFLLLMTPDSRFFQGRIFFCHDLHWKQNGSHRHIVEFQLVTSIGSGICSGVDADDSWTKCQKTVSHMVLQLQWQWCSETFMLLWLMMMIADVVMRMLNKLWKTSTIAADCGGGNDKQNQPQAVLLLQRCHCRCCCWLWRWNEWWVQPESNWGLFTGAWHGDFWLCLGCGKRPSPMLLFGCCNWQLKFAHSAFFELQKHSTKVSLTQRATKQQWRQTTCMKARETISHCHKTVQQAANLCAAAHWHSKG